MKKILFTVALIATVTATILGILLHRTRSEQQRLERNQRALLGEVTLYKTRSEESAASVAVLELRIDELRRERKRDAQEIRSLGIRLRRAESYAKSIAEGEQHRSIALRDSVILRDTIHDTIWVFSTDDGHTSLRGRIDHDSLHYDLRHCDTIYQVVHRVPRKFLFLRFGTKAIHQDVWSSNPNTKIVYTEYVEFENKSKRHRDKRKR